MKPIQPHRFLSLPVISSFFLLMMASGRQSQAQTVRLEAESGQLSGGSSISTLVKGYSGAGFVTGFKSSSDKVTVTFQAAAGLYELRIGFITRFGEKGYNLTVNEESSSGMFPYTKTYFSSQPAGKFLLCSGINTISIGGGWNWYEIDYFEFTVVPPPVLTIPPRRLAHPNAAPCARSLQAWLVDHYGKKMLTGQQDIGDIQYVQSITGKIPAVGVFDFIEYSPSRREHGSNPYAGANNSENWIAWQQLNKNFVSFSWHWNAPADLIDEGPDKYWWSGFYTRATTFDIQAVLADPASSRYALLLRDMDVIAAELKKFQQANIPVLWRPLHEASGGWFWWGAKGPEPFKALWRLMYQRFTQYHGLNNLIWVYTHAPDKLDWYPGDDCVDIIGLDIYTDASSSMSNWWDDAQRCYGDRKLVTLSESGTLPIPGKVRAYGVWWSWFSIWSGSFIRDIAPATLISIYNDPDLLTSDELGNWRATPWPVCGDDQHPYPAGDHNQDCQVNSLDLSILASGWIQPMKLMNLSDLLQLSVNWLLCTTPESPCYFRP